MRFPPIKADRGLIWISLSAGEDAAERYAALRAILKQCRLHPLDTTGSAELAIIDPAAILARADEVRAVLGAGDLLHVIMTVGGRLSVEVIAGVEAAADELPRRTPDRRPPWLPLP